MGYRTYIGFMPKKEYNKIKSLTKDELYSFYNLEKNDYKGVYSYGKELYEFGKYTDFEPPKKSMKSFFKKQELKEAYSGYEFYIVTSEFLKYIIEYYAEKVRTYYAELLKPFKREKWEYKSEYLKTAQRKLGSSDQNYETYFVGDTTKITEEENIQIYKIIRHFEDMASEWGVNDICSDRRPYNLNMNNDIISGSWKYEYAVFELTKIYKTFDWKKNVMIYYGY